MSVGRPKIELTQYFIEGLTDDCWKWLGNFYNSGYGQKTDINGNNTLAHILVYKQFLINDLLIYLQCNNKWCVNPNHLQAITQRENVLRGDTLAANNLAKTTCPKGHEYSGLNLYMHKGKRYCKICVRENNRKNYLFKSLMKSFWFLAYLCLASQYLITLL